MSLSTRLELSPTNKVTLTAEQTAGRTSTLENIETKTWTLVDVPCFCGKTEAIPIAGRDHAGLPTNACLCMSCGLLRTSPRLSNDALEMFYRENYRPIYDSGLTVEQRFAGEKAKGAGVLQQLPSLMETVNTVYQVGCGTGGILAAFAQAGKAVTGVGSHKEYLDYGRSEGLTLIEGDAQALLAEKKAPADLVLIHLALERWIDLRKQLEAATALVKPEGSLLVMARGIRNLDIPEYHNDLLTYFKSGAINYFTAQTLAFVLRSIGLDITLANEQIIAVAKRPADWKPGAPLVDPPVGEALSVLSFLAETERKFLVQSQDTGTEESVMKLGTAQEGSEVEPWPLSTTASLRVLAWPRYESIDALTTMLRVAEPLFNMKGGCLCLRYDRAMDIPYEQAVAQLQKAFDIVAIEGDLNILVVDDPMPKSDWPRLGRAATCILQVDPDIDDVRKEFVASLGIEVISGTATLADAD